MIQITDPVLIAYLNGIATYSPIINDGNDIGRNMRAAIMSSVTMSDLYGNDYLEILPDWHTKLISALDLAHQAYCNVPVTDKLIYMSSDHKKGPDLRAMYFEVMLPKIEELKKLMSNK